MSETNRWWLEEGGGDAPPAEAIERMRRTVEAATAMLWRADIGRGISPWRAFYVTLAAQLPIRVEYVPPVVWEGPDGRQRREERAAYTDGRSIVFNAAVLGGHSPREILGVLLHELEHVARRHLARRGDRDPFLWNVATDAVINAQLQVEGIPLPEGAIGFPDVSHEDLEEEVYDRLLQRRPPTPGGWMDVVGPAAAEGGDSRELEDALLAAAAAAARLAQQGGRLPGWMEEWIRARRVVRPPWVAQLRAAITSAVRVRRTWSRLNRRSAFLGVATPGRRHLPDMIGVVVDTSGSMGAEALAVALGTIRATASGLGTGVRLWMADAEVYGPIEYPDPAAVPDTLEVKGRGGTLMAPAAAAVARTRQPLVLWLTDGEWVDSPALPPGMQHVCVLIDGRRPPDGVRFDAVVEVRP